MTMADTALFNLFEKVKKIIKDALDDDGYICLDPDELEELEMEIGQEFSNHEKRMNGVPDTEPSIDPEDIF